LKLGIVVFPTDQSMDVSDLGAAVEDMGFESLWFPDHSHIPASRRTPNPNGGELPEMYRRLLDPFLALTAVALATSTLRIGTGICLAMQRDPITMAKEVATLDLLSRGRLLFGVGGGWNEEEMEDHGTRPRLRWRVLAERVSAMKQIWTHETAEFHGRYVDFGPMWSWPKPVQQPHPMVLVGGNGPKAIEGLLEYGDAWMPGAALGPEGVLASMGEIHEQAKSQGRGPFPVTIYGTPADSHVVAKYEDIGVERCIFWLPSLGSVELLQRLRRLAPLVADFQ
jgi:probable F420-dependent oxidoreductase